MKNELEWETDEEYVLSNLKACVELLNQTLQERYEQQAITPRRLFRKPKPDESGVS